LFNLGRHLVSAKNYRFFRQRAFATWEEAAAIIVVGNSGLSRFW